MKKPLTIEKLIKLVTEEAINLKANATQEELDELDLVGFSPREQKHCIYGQMTGHCDSERAVELIMKSCKRVMNTREYDLDEINLNGKPTKKGRLGYFSPIELFIGLKDNSGWRVINQDNGNNEILIKFLKNKRSRVLKFNKINL
jgi:hypothetical protein